MPWLPNLHSAAGDLKFFANRVIPNYTVEVAETDGKIAGFVSYADDWVEQLYIDPPYWRNGFGSDLLARALDGVTYRQLWVFEQNSAAQKFYARHGFEVVERTDGSNNEEKCPDLRMEWRA
jgi:GNAT superfamily N-acetyltransferase